MEGSRKKQMVIIIGDFAPMPKAIIINDLELKKIKSLFFLELNIKAIKKIASLNEKDFVFFNLDYFFANEKKIRKEIKNTNIRVLLDDNKRIDLPDGVKPLFINYILCGITGAITAVESL